MWMMLLASLPGLIWLQRKWSNHRVHRYHSLSSDLTSFYAKLSTMMLCLSLCLAKIKNHNFLNLSAMIF